ncbi:hypothetical protein M2128_000127 [Polynucleobacter sphagniphilus]|uniref:hypothetical protein n=1 Tax=Polynucleobacter sphagniphilus TaxID=1743169 RepID=UPI002475BF05|nr:hypothetical protein [Polynucleobacter sphagniphilus]MDH6301225.1 hypothetical protein [Polynucleobacter sphagniphilus]
MKTNYLLSLMVCGVIASTSALAQQQTWERTDSASTTSNQSASDIVSMYRILQDAFERSDIATRPGADIDGEMWSMGKLFFTNIFFQNKKDICVQLQPSGEIMREEGFTVSVKESVSKGLKGDDSMKTTGSAFDFYRILVQRSDQDRLLKQTSEMVVEAKLKISLILSNILVENYAQIASSRMSQSQATIFLTKKINESFDTYFQSSENLTQNLRIFFYPRTPEKLDIGSLLCDQSLHPMSGGIPVMAFTHPTSPVVNAREPISEWRGVAGQYQIKMSDGRLSIIKNGVEWISDSVIEGRNLQIASSKAVDSSSGLSKKKNQVQ